MLSVGDGVQPETGLYNEVPCGLSLRYLKGLTFGVGPNEGSVMKKRIQFGSLIAVWLYGLVVFFLARFFVEAAMASYVLYALWTGNESVSEHGVRHRLNIMILSMLGWGVACMALFLMTGSAYGLVVGMFLIPASGLMVVAWTQWGLNRMLVQRYAHRTRAAEAASHKVNALS